MDAERDCKKCKGTGQDAREWARSLPSYTGPEVCSWCRGSGKYPAVDVAAIITKITKPNKTTGKRTLKKSAPVAAYGGARLTVEGSRAYYVWRMARFHGGEDVCLPMGAQLFSDADPFLPELDAVADAVAKQAFGTDLAAAHRWGRAFGYVSEDLPGLPATAYSGGPEKLD